MICSSSRRCDAPRATTLLETLIVLFIIGIMLAFLMPAVQRARSAARDTVCKNNLHQLVVALTHYRAAKKKFPEPAPPNSVGGWAIQILPFLEEQVLADQLAGEPSIDIPSIAQQISHRPLVMSCPYGFEGDSSVAGVPASHYARNIRWSSVGDVPVTSHIPWVQSLELDLSSLPRDEGPHDGGYYIAQYNENSLSGDVRWFAGK
jgi:type II secretory pathway pseudopilin PulG